MDKNEIQEGDLVELIGSKHFHQIIRVRTGEIIQSHIGLMKMDDLIGKPWGSVGKSHNGNIFFILQPALSDLIKNVPRNTQILYPKDIGFLLLNLAIGAGKHVVEAGTGSGALTIALAKAVGDEGKVYSYEARPEMQKIAKENLQFVGLDSRVIFKIRDIVNGFDEENVDAIFLDLPNAYDYLSQVRKSLKPGGFFGSILPTMNQVTLLLEAFKRESFAFVEVCEILIRYYQTDADRFRPVDRMVGHTGFLIFSRMIQKKASSFPTKNFDICGTDSSDQAI